MRHRIDREARGGFTLIEIMIALAILGIVVVIAVSNFQGMMEKYRVEGETKQMFADLTDVRARAMQRNRVFHVQITTDGYKTFEDIFPAPDGDTTLTTGSEKQVASVTVKRTITPTAGLSGFQFNRNGIASVTGFILFSTPLQPDLKPDYNCITVKATRIKMGQYIGDNCVER